MTRRWSYSTWTTRLLLLTFLLLSVSSIVTARAERTAEWSSRLVNLRSNILQLLEEQNVPGVSVALMADHRIVALEGFGVTNRYFPRQVNSRTLFEVASVGKAVAAYGALTLVDQGVLDLDQDLGIYLEKPWLREQNQDVPISLRQVLSHSSGLSNGVRTDDRHVYLSPGEQFQYSGMGFIYLQAVLEHYLDQSINVTMDDAVFKPLSMASASYLPNFESIESVAWGHMPVSLVLHPILVPVSFLLALVVYGNGKRKGRITLTRIGFIVLLLSIGAVFLFYGVKVLGLELFSALVATLTALTTLAWAAFWLGGLLLRRIGTKSAIKKFHKPILLFWAAVILTVLVYSAPSIHAPVPGAPARNGVLAWSLHSTAEDLAKFTLAVMNARPGSHIEQMTHAHIQASRDSHWGLGLGIGHGNQGTYFYHTGDNPGFKALILGFPDSGNGLVVLTNGDKGAIVAESIAKRLYGDRALNHLLP